jgi:hypothetical protein
VFPFVSGAFLNFKSTLRIPSRLRKSSGSTMVLPTDGRGQSWLADDCARTKFGTRQNIAAQKTNLFNECITTSRFDCDPEVISVPRSENLRTALRKREV